ncbi:hypothetical protein EVAR_12778_1 [Eumeta japonica]|uniref:Uncharacterized protein n=1 Tax=Eumeta variegata TaxID=151549 RepID=A0A4C1UAY3_EUMVA|nr:hypothetical protein EVAR_12778_1 [Eumeta japonica]
MRCRGGERGVGEAGARLGSPVEVKARTRANLPKLERSVGPVCVEGWGEGGSGPVAEVGARSEPALLRLLAAEERDTAPRQPVRARDRLTSFCRKLRRTISELETTKKAEVSSDKKPSGSHRKC